MSTDGAGKGREGAGTGPNETYDEDQAGKASVKHGPHDSGKHGSDSDLGSGSPGGSGSGSPGDVLGGLRGFGGLGDVRGAGGPGDLGDLGGLDAEEEALRDMLQRSVRGLEPTNGSLEHLRRAVPARAARKRHALVGAAAALLFVGTAVPALIHVSQSGGASNDRTSIAGHGEPSRDGDGGDGSSAGESAGTQVSASPSPDRSGDGKPGHGKGDSGASTGGPDPDSTAAVSSPSCGPAELGNATASINGPDGEGKIYGTFRVANVSSANCTVDGAGTVNPIAQGAAQQANINVVDHTAGDAATGLPDPSLSAGTLVLQPGMAYEVKFAWVPSASCPTTGGGNSGGGDGGPTSEPTPDPSPSTTAPATSTEETGVNPQLLAEDGGTTDPGSVTVSHTAEPGAPSTGVTIPDACAGTVYRTGVLAEGTA